MTQKKSLADLAATVTIPEPGDPTSILAVQDELDNMNDEYFVLKNHLPKGVNIRDAIDFGFYEYKNRYWVRRKGDNFEPVSNFIIHVKYLIMGANPKRIVEITNVFHKKATLDFQIEDLISLEKFKNRVEGQGNFLFEGNARDLGRIKTKLLNLEQPSIEISRLGQYKDKFWAFANGLYVDGNFMPIDDSGMVKVSDENFYIPVFGSTRADDDEDLRNYRRFAHTPNSITFSRWCKLFHSVYGDNGIMGISFLFFSLFSDIIFERTKAAPMLFLFGQRGSGKGTMANSMLYAFGTPQDPLMLGGASTVVGFMRKLGQFSNAITWLDEYKNDIGEKKIESLKNIWDRVGYERGVKDSSNKTQTTPVTSSAIISGQEIPNVEPALFSRTILCEFRTMQHDQRAIDTFNQLRLMEDAGITNATLEILQYRDLVKETFQQEYNQIATALRAAFAADNIIERMVVNYSILITMVKIIGDQLELPFTWQDTLQISERYMKRQNSMMSTANEVQQFFEMIAFLLSTGLIRDGKDMYIKGGSIMLRMVTIFPLYREYSRRQGIKAIDRGTLGNYLQNSPAYIEEESKKSSHRFPELQNPTNAVCFLQHKVEELYSVDFKAISQNTENQEDVAKPDEPDVF